MQKLHNYINGVFVPAIDGEVLDNVEPATGRVYAHVPRSKQADVHAAVESAERAFPTWASTPADVRASYLFRIADILEARLEAFAQAESKDQGKTVTTARTVDIPRSVENFRFYASFITQLEDMSVESKQCVHYALRKAIGVVGLVSPWNLPLYLATWKVAPAIAFGNTCIIKPSEMTPMTMFMLCSIFDEAKLPPGVVNVVHGLGQECGQAIAEHPRIPAISFTGGTITGKRLASTTAPLLKKLSLELGGKNANIVFADCDLDDCVATSVRSSFTNQGEICLCGSRILVERSIFPQFLEKFVAVTKTFKAGDPQDASSNMGALISKAHFDKVASYVALAKKEGGTIVTGGQRPSGLPNRCSDGFFLEPTIITGLSSVARCNQEEIFGPVVTVMPFDTEEEAVRIANGTVYGLSASVWTNNARRANRVSQKLDAGYVWVNCWLIRDLRMPFGGVKASGIGREGGKFAMDFYTEVKSVCSKL
jgi:aminomuconate-semialdehyde/2-hydroxymuconate-6-semialdehyde dehydrogenase